METRKILSGYEITFENGKIISLIKDGRQVKFPFKFFENNKAELEIFENIQDFVKPEQNRSDSERVSVNLANGQANTTDSDRLVKGALALINNVSADVDVKFLKNIIQSARQKAVSHDSTIKELNTKVYALSEMLKTMIQVFGETDSAVIEAKEKVEQAKEKVKAREKELLDL